MKSLILLFALTTVIIFAACDKDPLGIEDNILIIPLHKPEDTIPIPDVKTKFRADTVICEFSEKIKLTNSNDTLSVRWNPLLLDASAVIDTLGGLKLDNLLINAQRFQDTLAEYRKEHILGFHMNLDSFKIVDEYITEHNTGIYASKIILQIIPTKKVETIHGNYPIKITFKEPDYETRKLIIKGRFQIIVPTMHQPKKYDYNFVGDFIIHFTIE